MSDAGTLRKTKSAGDLPASGSPTAVGVDSLKEELPDDPDATLTEVAHSSTHSVHLAQETLAPVQDTSSPQPGPSVLVFPRPFLPPELVPLPETPGVESPTTVAPMALAPAPSPPLPNLNISTRRTHQNRYTRILAFLGVGRNASSTRRSNMSLAWNFSWALAQAVVIIVMLAIATNTESYTQPGQNEWEACSRPLGVWSCLWLARICLSCGLYWWRWNRDRATQATRTDVETATPHDAQAASPPRPNTVNNAAAAAAALPHTKLYKKLTFMSSLFSFSWFVSAHILVYTSINTCRLSSPHLWWLDFGILCITYLMVIEVVVLTVVVFILAPILFLFWNIFLMCLGRHPLQNPGIIKPEIGKLPKTVVDQIPLVMYIPPPPDASLYPQSPIKLPAAVYTYPPKSPSPASAAPRRFRWFKKKTKNQSTNSASTTDKAKVGEKKKKSKNDGPQTWEEHWEDEGYPFVVLEGNRAACAICLMDFEEPKKVGGAETPLPETAVPVEAATAPITEEQRQEELKLEDAGEGAQPLRLLDCGHVFHRTCLDPWLTDVSGRCPVCQRAVDLDASPKSKQRAGT